MKKKYELMAIVRSSITDKEIQDRIASLKEMIGSEVVFEEKWGIRPLAYRIKKEPKGFYVVWNFMFEPEELFELERNIRLLPDVIRFLLINLPEGYEPMTLAQIEAGLEKLRDEKSKKRGTRPGMEAPEGAPMRKESMSFKESSPAKASLPLQAKPEVKPAALETAASAGTPLSGVKEEDKKPKKSFDQKLEDILRDDSLGL